jgi:hypothetical protein
MLTLNEIFNSIELNESCDINQSAFTVLPIPEHENYFVGKDNQSRACLLISTIEKSNQKLRPIRLECLDVQFELSCRLYYSDNKFESGRFTVIRCRVQDLEIINYFLSICEIVIRILGDKPSQNSITKAISRLADIFQQIQNPPAKHVNGLFGELLIIKTSRSPSIALEAWRNDEVSRFDFMIGDVRLDVKTTGGRTRLHTFTYEQCNPPSGTIAVAASIFVERASKGETLRSVIAEIEEKVSHSPDLVFKLHEVIATTLGNCLNVSLDYTFDINLSEKSLCFYNINDIPAIRGSLPSGVSDVHFRSDLSSLQTVSIKSLIDTHPDFWDLLPIEQ